MFINRPGLFLTLMLAAGIVGGAIGVLLPSAVSPC